MGIYAFLFLVGMEGTSGVFMLGYISYILLVEGFLWKGM
jgi:hypothetical protein